MGVGKLYCSWECRSNQRKISIRKICSYCKKVYFDCPTRRLKYCSRKCKISKWKETTLELLKKRREIRLPVKCLTCGSVFYPLPAQIRIGRGKYCSYRCKHQDHARISKFSKGENHYRWQGGITSKEKKIRQSDKYNNWRLAVLKKDNFTCQKCGQYGGRLHADHIKPFKLYPELRFDINNGQTLCVPCHYIKNGEDVREYGYRGYWVEGMKYAYI